MAEKLSRIERKNENAKKVALYYNSCFTELTDICGLIAYCDSVVKKDGNNSFYKLMSTELNRKAEHRAKDLANYAKRLGWKIGRKKALIKLLVESKERRKYYKYKIKALDKNKLAKRPQDIESSFQAKRQ